jgi:exopolysaccharide biosynthesis protein PssK
VIPSAVRTNGTTADLDLVRSLRHRTEEVLERVVPPGCAVALVDFPNHANAGDAAIWLGEIAWIKGSGRRLAYVCDRYSYSPAHLEDAIGDGVILLHGGGNFGDLYIEHQRLREAVIGRFPDHKIVQLPQTIHFSGEGHIRRAQAVLARHPDVTLLARDARSLEFSESHFDAAALLCPDMALQLGPWEGPRASSPGIVWLARADRESVLDPVELGDADVGPIDWMRRLPEEPYGRRYALLRVTTRKLGSRVSREPQIHPGMSSMLGWAYDRIAKQRLAAARKLLGRREILVTDRLHGHILSLLQGTPTVLLDNGNGKVRSFYETWTSPSELTSWSDSAADALRMARAMTSLRNSPDR